MEAALDTRCPVCLDNWDSAAYTMPCCHQFCFPCIQRWTSTRPQCPLCKQGVQSIIHTVRADNDYQELVLRPAAAASVASLSTAGLRAARPWSAVPRRPAGGLSSATWASLFREHPALLRPLRSWLQRKLRRILGTEEPQADTLANSVISALLLVGLDQEILIEMLDLNLHGQTGNFVRQFIAFTVQRCGREAHRLQGLNVTPAAGAQDTNPASEPRAAPQQEAPVPGPAPSGIPASSNRDEMLGRTGEDLDGRPSHPHSNPAADSTEQAVPREEPGQPVAGPSGHSLPQQPRRAPKRKASDSQASASPKKRPPRRQQ